MLTWLGKTYLYLRFREEETVKRELNRKYEGEFRNVGTVLLADVFMALVAVFSVSLIAGLLYLFVK
jgi:uncharacterized membrane protein YjgN (DUF898 family)